jgi:hypothetical protein
MKLTIKAETDDKDTELVLDSKEYDNDAYVSLTVDGKEYALILSELAGAVKGLLEQREIYWKEQLQWKEEGR